MRETGELYRGRAIVKLPARKNKWRDVQDAARSFEVDCGPYSTPGAAKTVTTQEINSRTNHLHCGSYELFGEIEVERWIEKAETTWTRLPE
ncbi:hypothetical protein AB0J80_36180 [Actinoplanes sp. NPDC049548]|uniref:hypothetical protein n=1 Tax=Actinoplanes sp. NPDC049548 TaxID=3155152 RepID=UPI0034136CC7